MDKMYSKTIETRGHIIDSGLMTKIFDTIVTNHGKFKIKKFQIGTTNDEVSKAVLEISAQSQKQLDFILNELNLLGCTPVDLKEVTLAKSEADQTVPEDFYSTTNHKTEIYHKNKWHKVEKQRMDGVIVIKDKPVCTKLRDVKQGDMVVTGFNGIKVTPPPRDREREDFVFMDNEVSSEKKVELKVKTLAKMMKDIKKSNGKIIFVLGPVVVHTGGSDALAKLIKKGYVSAILSGNAVAVHDIENALYNTSLGIHTETGAAIVHGHRHHMRAINTINKAGSIKSAVEKNILKSGIMYECIKNNVPFALAGSIRDDGPLPDTEMDLIKAQEHYTQLLQDVDMVVILSSMLHGIGTGNMLPSWVKTVCVDINPAVVTKLMDRGSAQTIGIVTDVGLFLHLLSKAL